MKLEKQIDNGIESVYKELIIDLYKHPLNKTDLVDFDFVNRQLNPSCGDEIELKIKFAAGRVSAVGFQGEGCAISQAAASLLTEEVRGKDKADISRIDERRMLELIPIPISHTRRKCALLAWSTLKNIET